VEVPVRHRFWKLETLRSGVLASAATFFHLF
jgi:hypothetical protein